MNVQPEWLIGIAERTPVFHDLLRLHPGVFRQGWPEPERLNLLAPVAGRSRAGRRLYFAADDGAGLTANAYEQTIFSSGRIPTRRASWHDLFNALMWSTFPQAKAAINAGHAGDPRPENRSRRRDALTLLDECGVIVAATDPEFEWLNRQHRWIELFWERRPEWGVRLRPYLFGHGLLEQCLRPYSGLTAKALYIAVPPGWFGLPLQRQVALLDDRLAGEVATLRHPGRLLPFPVLGVPGWDPLNGNRSYYEDRDYFRPLA